MEMVLHTALIKKANESFFDSEILKRFERLALDNGKMLLIMN